MLRFFPGYSSVRLQLCPSRAVSRLQNVLGNNSVRVTVWSVLQPCPVRARAGLQLCPGYSSLSVTALSGLQFGPGLCSVRGYSSVLVTAGSCYRSVRITAVQLAEGTPSSRCSIQKAAMSDRASASLPVIMQAGRVLKSQTDSPLLCVSSSSAVARTRF